MSDLACLVAAPRSFPADLPAKAAKIPALISGSAQDGPASYERNSARLERYWAQANAYHCILFTGARQELVLAIELSHASLPPALPSRENGRRDPSGLPGISGGTHSRPRSHGGYAFRSDSIRYETFILSTGLMAKTAAHRKIIKPVWQRLDMRIASGWPLRPYDRPDRGGPVTAWHLLREPGAGRCARYRLTMRFDPLSESPSTRHEEGPPAPAAFRFRG
jgi:hypothetical protein